MRQYQGLEAIAVSGMAVVNTALGLAQELRAKRHLDQLAIVVETRVKVLRDGASEEIPAGAVVVGDHVFVAGGELDASLTARSSKPAFWKWNFGEALLTGESDPVRRHPGEQLLSGSICVAGEGRYRADKVGSAAFANQTGARARQYHAAASPLTQVINRLVRILSFIALGLIALFTVAYVLEGSPKSPRQQRAYVRVVAATITSMVPQGMVLTATIAFMLGAIALSRRGAIVQRLQAVETMAAIDVICTDKTGTLTTNQLHLEGIDRLDDNLSEEAVRQRLRAFVSASVDRDNKNVQAIRAALGATPALLLEQIPF